MIFLRKHSRKTHNCSLSHLILFRIFNGMISQIMYQATHKDIGECPWSDKNHTTSEEVSVGQR